MLFYKVLLLSAALLMTSAVAKRLPKHLTEPEGLEIESRILSKVIHPQNHNRGGVFLGTAYDLVQGNPHGGDLGKGGMDPGLKRTVKVLKTTNQGNPNSDCPDQANCVPVGTVCSRTVEESLILDSRDYVDSFSTSLNLEGTGVGPELLTHTGGVSLGFERAVELLEQRNKSILFKKAVCVFGESGFKSDRDLLEIELDEYFTAALCRLATRQTDDDLFRFFKQWGTHAIVGLTVGTKDYEHSEVDTVELIRAMQTDYTGSIFYEAGWFQLFTARVTLAAKKSAREYIQEFHAYGNTLNFTSGTETFPEPVSLRLRSLESFMDAKYLPRSADQICPGVRSTDTMANLKQAITYGLEKYPTWLGAEQALHELMREIPAPKHWPTGYYGLLKTNEECQFDWLYGKRFHDTANVNTPDNSWSPGFASRTSSQVWANDVALDFCMKEFNDPNAPRSEWPMGSYCIYKSKKSPCPFGFSEGTYEHDDDDYYNKNFAVGTLPDGKYNHNTIYKYCCRDDSSPFKPMFLPVERSFILMPKRGVCQEVFGMNAEMHYIHLDCENHWFSTCELKGSTPYGYKLHDGDHELFFCYYSRKN
ncbi:uncharacterized protein LOC129591909 [Paramacrobiotus metropolitanus]|uniref:uncharacterized protein LOC129591909 n=1 Tax=Paramacrobiotus metropolitanus TaxID=2943436 RepID=UPI0024463186|nr:uncharacterized protein LOC129591909 [Paramacrobiotus metropolitanus]